MPTPDKPASYIGRFAPSPTGPLHLGSLVAAVASYLDARHNSGQWLVRMEDVDETRNVPGAADSILRDLEAFGFAWDGEVVYQTDRIEAYRAALDRLIACGAAYPCGCSRKEIAEANAAIGAGNPEEWSGPRYPGTCRAGLSDGRQERMWRVRVDLDPGEVRFTDRAFGPITQDLDREVGDFVVLRADGLFAYQLAVVVDDAEQGVTDVVRGEDLLDSTPRQIYLQRRLGDPQPRYLHIPVVRNADGNKLSKQAGAVGLDSRRAPEQLAEALRFLQAPIPPELNGAPVAELWPWAIEHWDTSPWPLPREVAFSRPSPDEGNPEDWPRNCMPVERNCEPEIVSRNCEPEIVSQKSCESTRACENSTSKHANSSTATATLGPGCGLPSSDETIACRSTPATVALPPVITGQAIEHALRMTACAR